MTRAEVSKLLHLIRALSPKFTIVPSTDDTPGTGDAWHDLLADVPFIDAAQAVRAHFVIGGPWIEVGDIRRRVIAARGLLPPDTEAAYAQAREMNRWLNRRTGPEPSIHPAVYKTMSPHENGIGWEAIDGRDGYAHRRFVDAYTPVSVRETEAALMTPLAALEAAKRTPKALEGGSGVEAAEREAQAAVHADRPRAEAVKVQIRRSGFGRTIPARADYGPATDIQKTQAADALRAWAAQNGYEAAGS
ncbi:hypothetical protein [Parafrankia sp. EUN1f]|uniref:hypothetical protein n=1 Tax=Parafrankia sp. EUN1f TaxID=102897 RepID=UPI0001C47475|nr:hypothetical protein [Parafrankia sp. EUN1f]EFC80071.1 hypothetical protein FrEUN1fDRAFT_6798 [Parafrankia sp. EUN1f]